MFKFKLIYRFCSIILFPLALFFTNLENINAQENKAVDKSENSGIHKYFSSGKISSPQNTNSLVISGTAQVFFGASEIELKDGFSVNNLSELGNFTAIAKSFLKVTSPSSRTTTATGNTITVFWETGDITENVKIEFYNGSTWVTIVSSTANDGWENIKVPAVSKTTTNSKIVVSLASNSEPIAFSQDFVVKVQSFLKVTSPSSSTTTWVTGTFQEVTWETGTSTERVNIGFYNGSTWVTILSSTYNDGSEKVLVPSVSSKINNAKIVVSLTSNSDIAYSQNFVVEVNESEITSPKSGNDWYNGGVYKISWVQPFGLLSYIPVLIYLYEEGDVENPQYTYLGVGYGSYKYLKIKSDYSKNRDRNHRARIIIKSKDKILNVVSEPFIFRDALNITSPSKDEVVVYDASLGLTLKWTKHPDAPEDEGLNLVGLLPDNSEFLMQSNEIKVSDYEGTFYGKVLKDEENEIVFRLQSKGNDLNGTIPLVLVSPPSITVTSPTISSLWTSGETATVTWSSKGMPTGQRVNIDLLDESGIGHQLAFSTDNDGSEIVTLPKWTKPVNNAKIRVYLTTNTAVSDHSDEFTISPACVSTISTYPYSEGFETGLGIWTQSTVDDFDWTRQSGKSPQTYSGPSSAHGGSYYLYTDGNLPNHPHKTAILTSDCFSFSTLSKPELRFWYNMYGYGMGTLEIQVSTDRGGHWSSAVWSQTGDKGDVWKEAIVNLETYANKTVLIRFKGSTSWTFSSNMAIDDIRIGEATNCLTAISVFPYAESFETGIGNWEQNSNDDADWYRNTGETTNIFTGPSSAKDGSYYMHIKSNDPLSNIKTGVLTSPCFDLTKLKNPELNFWYHMYGTSMGLLDIQVSTDGGNTWNTTIWSKIGNQGNSWKEAKVDLSNYQGNSIKVRFRGTTKNIIENDMAIDNIRIRKANPCEGLAISTFPYSESFESGFGNWSQDSEDDKEWTQGKGPTSQVFTGPSEAKNGTYYAYINSFDSQNRNDLSSIITSACFDLTALTRPTISFWYHMYGQPQVNYKGMGTLQFQISTNGGNTWSTIWTKSGNQGDSWQEAIIDLSLYVENSVKFRFAGTTGDATRSDIAIDNIKLGTSNITITSPTSTATWGSGSSQTVAWNTFGIADKENVSIQFYNGSSWSTLVSATPNDGTEDITIPSIGNPIGNAQIKISLVSNSGINAVSGTFTITPPYCVGKTSLTATSGTLTDGSGSGNYQNNMDCFWEISLPPGKYIEFDINIEGLDGRTGEVTPFVQGDYLRIGGQSWFKCASCKTAYGKEGGNISNQTIEVYFHSDNSVTAAGWRIDYTIKDVPKTITLNSPSSGASWTSGSSQTITWNSSNIPATDNVKIEFYNGTSWSTIVASTPNDGTQAITVPSVNTTSAKIRVSSVSNSSLSSTSGSFTVTPAPAFCKGTVIKNSTSGTFGDGSGASDYQNNMECYWEIHNTSHTYINITFNIEGISYPPTVTDYANGDVLALDLTYNGVKAAYTNYPTGTGKKYSYNVQGSKILVQFKTNGSGTNKGWSANYKLSNIIENVREDSDVFENTNLGTLETFPNPVNEKLNIIYKGASSFSINLFNSIGVEVLHGKFPSPSEIDLSKLGQGIYLLEVTTDEEVPKKFLKKIFIER